jgi:TolB-like protein
MDRRRLTLTCLLLALPAAVTAGPYDKLAVAITRHAERAGYSRVAVMPFQAVGGHASNGGMILSERLVSRLAAKQDLEVVERTLLDRVLSEQGLGTTGMVRPEDAKQVGRILGVEAIVTGTFLRLSHDRIEVHTRLIDTKSARIIGAVTAKVKREWQDSWIPNKQVWNMGSPKAEKKRPAFGQIASARGFFDNDESAFEVPVVRLIPDPFRDAPRDIAACVDWEDRADKLHAKTLELKARYWAAKIRRPGFSARSLKRNPGSEIRSLTTRHKFYARLKRLHSAGQSAPLDEDEYRRLVTADGLVEQLVDDCYR